MYEAMDAFLSADTWYKNHPNDEQRFYTALSTIVRQEGFNADELRNYIRAQKNVTTHDGSHPFEGVIDDLATKAWAVYDYLKITGQ